jgi:hypothetical protein
VKVRRVAEHVRQRPVMELESRVLIQAGVSLDGERKRADGAPRRVACDFVRRAGSAFAGRMEAAAIAVLRVRDEPVE